MSRQEAERVFYNKKYAVKRKKDYYAAGVKKIIFDNMMEKIGNIEGKRVLEFGCGSGWFTKVLAAKGAEVWAFDISNEAVKNARDLIESHNLEHRVHVDRMAAEDLDYDSNMFDLVVGNAVLHHVDLNLCVNEIKRVLKDRGWAYFMEPLGHNPFLNAYRRLTPGLRSKDEVPFRFEQFSYIRKCFPEFEHEEYYLTAMLALFWHFVGMRRLMLKTRDVLFRLDRRIIATFPKLSKYCWYSILTMGRR
jgi:ubiquinone/menaquinone biosynthesis C-methylase UbiE